MKSTHFIAVTAALGALAACAQLLGMQDFEQAERLDGPDAAPDVEAPLSPTFGGFNINQPLRACGAVATPPGKTTTHPLSDFRKAHYYVTSLTADLDGLNLDGVNTVSEETARCISRGTVVLDGEDGIDNAFSSRPLTSELIRALFTPIELGQFGVLFEMSQLQPRGGASTQTILQLYGVRSVDAGVVDPDAGTEARLWYQNPRSASVLSGWVNDAGSFAFTTPQVESLDIQLPGSTQPPYYLQLRLRHPVMVGCFTGPLRITDGGTDAEVSPVEYDVDGRPKHIEVLITGSVWSEDFTRMGSQIEYPTGSGSLVCALPPEFKTSVAGQFCEGRDVRIAPAPATPKPECDGMSVGFRIRARLIERNPAPDPDVDGGTWTMDPNRCAPGTELRCTN